MRDLKADLEICNKATPGPWEFNEYNDDYDVDIWSRAEPWRVANVGLLADIKFIAAAREGWPESIERAIKAESEVERLKPIEKFADKNFKLWENAAYTMNAKLRAENALLRKVEEVGEILWSEAICHRCNARECRGCAAHDFKRALSDYATWKETNGG